MDFQFEQQDRFKIQVFDSDNDKELQNLQQHDFIGELAFTLHEVVTTRDQTLAKALVNAKIAKPGRIKIHGEEMAATSNTELVMFTPEASNLKDMSG